MGRAWRKEAKGLFALALAKVALSTEMWKIVLTVWGDRDAAFELSSLPLRDRGSLRRRLFEGEAAIDPVFFHQLFGVLSQ